MRTELYERYKQTYPEELFEIGELKARTARIEKRRKVLRERKLEKVEKWRRILDGDDYSGRGE